MGAEALLDQASFGRVPGQLSRALFGDCGFLGATQVPEQGRSSCVTGVESVQDGLLTRR